MECEINLRREAAGGWGEVVGVGSGGGREKGVSQGSARQKKKGGA